MYVMNIETGPVYRSARGGPLFTVLVVSGRNDN